MEAKRVGQRIARRRVDEARVAKAAGTLITRDYARHLDAELLGRFEKIRDQTVAAIDRHRTEAARAREAIGAPFPDAEALTTARDRVAGLKAELDNAVRLLAGDPYLTESATVALQARTHPVEVDIAQQAHVDGPSDAQLAAVALASVSMPSTMSQRLGARSGTAKAPRQQPPQPPRPMSPETER